MSCLIMFLSVLSVVIVGLLGLSSADPCVLPFPKSYVAYHLDPNESLEVDGKLEEDAWLEVAWTDPFIGTKLLNHFRISLRQQCILVTTVSKTATN